MADRIIDVSDRVICDSCAAVFKPGSPAVGGILFERKAICPGCAPKWERDAARFNETHFISARAEEGETFFAAVMRWRAGNNTVRITGSPTFVAEMAQMFEDRK